MNPTNPHFPDERLDHFLVVVVDRLARIETKHDAVIAHLSKLNGTVAHDGSRINASTRSLPGSAAPPASSPRSSPPA